MCTEKKRTLTLKAPSTPFGYGRGEGINAGIDEVDWIVNKNRDKYDQSFHNLNPVDGKVSGAAAKAEMVKSKLPNAVLGKVWKLADTDKDGMLDVEEFALAMHLIRCARKLSKEPLSTQQCGRVIPVLFYCHSLETSIL